MGWKTKEQRKEYLEAHKEHIQQLQKIRNRRYYLKNKEKAIQQSKEWAKDNHERYKECLRERARRWRHVHPENSKSIWIKYALNHPEERKESYRKYTKTHPEKARAKAKIQKARRRGMSFISLNHHFEGAEGHHIDNEKVIHIPKFIHKLYPHNHNKPETMKEINKFAFNYLFGIVQQVKLF